MRRLAVIVGVSALVLAGSAFAAGLGSQSGTARPVLRLVDKDPVTVHGVNFTPNAGVTIVAASSEPGSTKVTRQTKQARTGDAGGFTTVLPSVSLDGCGPFSITATDAAGKHATYKIVPQCGALY